MGSGHSRLGSRPRRSDRKRTPKRSFSALFICGASFPHSHSDETEDDPAELLVNSAEHIDQQKLKNPMKDPASVFNSGIEIGVSSGRNVVNFEESLFEDDSSNVEGGNKGEILPENIEVASYNTVEDQPFYSPRSSSSMTNFDSFEARSSVWNERMPQVCGMPIQSSSASSHGIVESSLNGDLIGNRASDFFIFNYSDSSSSISAISDSPLTSHSSGYDTIPSGLEFREQSLRVGGMLQVGARHSSRRPFCDAFSRSSADSSAFVFVNDDSGDVWSRERWMHGFHDDSLGVGEGRDFRWCGSRAPGSSDDQLRHSRSEVWERLSGDLSASDHRTTNCPTGFHLHGPCLCDSMLVAQESSSHRISGMFVLAEALFEVLNEMDLLSAPLSMVPLPAPELVVDSFQVKSYSMKEGLASANDVSQCNICLAEYEEDDKIRVLPCHHEFHMECVDKWLKEIRGVCPLCRGDVRLQGSTSNLEAIHSM